MPVVLLERLPLPSLKTYTSISVLLLASAIYYAHQVVTDVETSDDVGNNTDINSTSETSHELRQVSTTNRTEENYFVDILDTLIEETWCVWTLVNMAYCCLILMGKMIQQMVFGNLRVSEQQHIKDKFWNFIFYKFIFIFGVMNVQNMEEVLLWCAWFSFLGFLHLMAQLCKDRFEYLSFSPTTPKWTHAKVLMLLFAIVCSCSLLTIVCFLVGINAGISVLGFMLAECMLLSTRTMYVIIRYAVHLLDLNTEGVWENRAFYVYYSELFFELSALSIDFAHHLHMLLYGNIFLSMASLVICMQLRYLFHEFQRRIKRHKNYLRVVHSMEAKFPMASGDEIEQNNDDCAICWDKMDSARKLPCSHLFHNACLRSWLEQDTSCPTCRTPLGDNRPPDAPPDPVVNPNPVVGEAAMIENPQPQPPVNRTTNHFFHFDGSRYVSWLPSFSVEVIHTHVLGAGPPQNRVQNSQYDNMARQVQEVFPNMPLDTILEDLQGTRSVEITIENIIEGRVSQPPTNFTNRNNTESPETEQSSEPIHSGEGDTVQETSQLQDPLENQNEGNINGASGDTGQGGLNYMMDDNLPDFSADLSEEIVEPTPTVTGYRFSKSPDERESMLQKRKDDMLEIARRKFLDKAPVHTLDTDSDSSGNEDVRSRREKILQATQRRLQGDSRPAEHF